MNFIDAIQQNKLHSNVVSHKTKPKTYTKPKIKTAKYIFTDKNQNILKELENYQDSTIKNAIISNITSQHNIHQQIYALFAIKKQDWESLPYLNGKRKREIFIEKLQQEINDVNRKNYNYPVFADCSVCRNTIYNPFPLSLIFRKKEVLELLAETLKLT